MAEQGAGQLEKIDLLLEASWARRYDNPQEMLYLAELALQAVLRLDEELFSRERVADLRARVWAELGNALRLTDHMARAEQALLEAVTSFEAGTRDPSLLALVASRLSTLLCHRRRFPEAFALLDRLYTFYRDRGQEEHAARSLLLRGLYTENSGDPASAVVITCRALRLLPAGRNAQLVLAGVHNLLWCATELGRFQLVERLLASSSLQALYGKDKLNILRRRWVEARVDAGLGRARIAEKSYRAIRRGFLDARLLFPASLVSLELALLLRRHGRFGEVRQIAQELITAFSALKAAREVLLSLVLLRRSCEKVDVDTEEVRERIELARRRIREIERSA